MLCSYNVNLFVIVLMQQTLREQGNMSMMLKVVTLKTTV